MYRYLSFTFVIVDIEEFDLYTLMEVVQIYTENFGVVFLKGLLIGFQFQRNLNVL